MNYSDATFHERRAHLLREAVSAIVVRPGGSVYKPTASEESDATRQVGEQMLDEIHSMLRALSRHR